MKTTKQLSRLALMMLCVILCISLFVSCGEEKTTDAPTDAPTSAPTVGETEAPTVGETEAPTVGETEAPTVAETEAPTVGETEAPTVGETEEPTVGETEAPTVGETEAPTDAETEELTVAETEEPTEGETEGATEGETEESTEGETEGATDGATEMPELDYAALPLSDYVSLDWTLLDNLSMEVSLPATVSEEDIDVAVIQVLAMYETTEITKDIVEDYLGEKLEDGADPEEALRECLRVELQDERDYSIFAEVVTFAWDTLMEAAVYEELPADCLAYETALIKEMLQSIYADYASEMTYEEFLLSWYEVEDPDTDIDALIRIDAEAEVKYNLLFFYIAKEKDFLPTDEELAIAVQEYCTELAAMENELDPEAGATAESVYLEFVEIYGEGFLEDLLYTNITSQMIQEMLFDACEVTYPPEGGDPELPPVDINEYENPVLFHTPTLDGVLDPEYKKSYHFDNEQYTELFMFDENGDPIYNAYSNRSTTYILWDGDYIYVAVERWDDDLIERTKAYTQEPNAKKDVNPWYNETCEVWYVFDMIEEWSALTDMRKVSYDACGIGDGPFSAISEGVYSIHFSQCDAAAKAYLNENPEDEEGLVHLSVLEFKIPAKTEDGRELLVDDFIWIAIQVDDLAYATDDELIAKGYDPETFEPNELASDISSGYTTTYTRARNVYPKDGENGGFGRGNLTDIRPSQVADPEE